MDQYISKATIATEIEKLKGKAFDDSSYCNGWQHALRMLEIVLNTLDVKEIGFDLGGPNEDIGAKTIWDEDKEVSVSEPSNNLEEAAKKAGQKYFPDEYNIWARTNYEAKAAEYAFKDGVNWQKEQMIDKACEWLKSYRQDTPDGTGYIAGIIDDKTIEEFKQAMKE